MVVVESCNQQPFSSISFGGMKRSRMVPKLVDLDVASGFRWLAPECCTLELHTPSDLLNDVFRDMLSFSSSPVTAVPKFPKASRKRSPPLHFPSYMYNGQYGTTSTVMDNNDDWCFGDLPPPPDDLCPLSPVAPLPRRFLVCSGKFSMKSDKNFLKEKVYDRHSSTPSSPMPMPLLSITG